MAGPDKGPPPTRKPYNRTKLRVRWSEAEHARFLEALNLFGRAWKEIVSYVATRSVAQVRSHAQKYFLKMEKEGHAKDVPPARPKKRATKPYPVQAKGIEETHPATRVRQGRRSERSARQQSLATAPSDTQLGSSATPVETGAGQENSAADQSFAAHLSSRRLADASAADQDAPSADSNEPASSSDQDYSELYAIVGSLFEHSTTVDQHLSSMASLQPKERRTLLHMLNHLSHNLKGALQQQHPEQQHQQLPEQYNLHSSSVNNQAAVAGTSGMALEQPWNASAYDMLWQPPQLAAAAVPPPVTTGSTTSF